MKEVKPELVDKHPKDAKLFTSLRPIRAGLMHIEKHIDASKFQTVKSLETDDFAEALVDAVERGGSAAVQAMRYQVVRTTTYDAGNDSLTEMSEIEQAKLFEKIAELAETPRALNAWLGIAADLQASHAEHNLTPEEVKRVFSERAGELGATN